MRNRKRPPWYKIEALEQEPRDPLVWLGQYAAADHRGDTAMVHELLRQLAQQCFAAGRTDQAMPEGVLIATLAVEGGATYRLVKITMEVAARLMVQQLDPSAAPRSTASGEPASTP